MHDVKYAGVLLTNLFYPPLEGYSPHIVPNGLLRWKASCPTITQKRKGNVVPLLDSQRTFTEVDPTYALQVLLVQGRVPKLVVNKIPHICQNNAFSKRLRFRTLPIHPTSKPERHGAAAIALSASAASDLHIRCDIGCLSPPEEGWCAVQLQDGASTF